MNFSPNAAGHDRGQPEARSTAGAVGAIVAEVTSQRRLRPRQQDLVHRGTPMSDSRQAAAQPRLLWSDLVDSPVGYQAKNRPTGKDGGFPVNKSVRTSHPRVGFKCIRELATWCAESHRRGFCRRHNNKDFSLVRERPAPASRTIPLKRL